MGNACETICQDPGEVSNAMVFLHVFIAMNYSTVIYIKKLDNALNVEEHFLFLELISLQILTIFMKPLPYFKN